MQCPECNAAVEQGSSDMYVKCTSCKKIWMNVAGKWQVYPIDDATRQFIEPSLGFKLDPAFAPKAKPVPEMCTTCGGKLEKLEKDGDAYTRCADCGILCSWDGNFLMPIIVEAPGSNGWDAEFQASFEEQLGFTKKVRKLAPGVKE